MINDEDNGDEYDSVDDNDNVDNVNLCLPGIFNGSLISKGYSYLPFRTTLSS